MAFIGSRMWRLRRQVDRHKGAALRLMREGRFLEARQQSLLALVVIEELRAREPDEPEHLEQLGGLYYNLAAINEQDGEVRGAVSSAQKALELYIMANGGDVTPLSALIDVVGPVASGKRGPGSPQYAANIADAKARLGRMIARFSGRTGGAAEARRLCKSAVTIYRQLVRTNPHLADDLKRVERQHADAESHL